MKVTQSSHLFFWETGHWDPFPCQVLARHRAVAYSAPLFALELRLVGGAPRPLKSYLNLLKPFPAVVWGFWAAGELSWARFLKKKKLHPLNWQMQ